MKAIVSRIASLCIKYPWVWTIFKYIVVPVVALVDLAQHHIPELIQDYKQDIADIEALIGKARSAQEQTTQ